MARVETAEMIARSRLVTAQALFEGCADLRGYPFQLLGVVSQQGAGMDNLSAVIGAAEFLMPYGWDLVNVAELTGTDNACAMMRRRPGSHP